MVIVLSVITVTSLLVVRQSVEREVRRQTLEAVSSSVRSFDRLQRQQYESLLRTAAMMAELPTLKAVLATEHPATIQDASQEFWKLSGTDLLILADTRGTAMAVHASSPRFSPDSVKHILRSVSENDQETWWEDSSGLYRIVQRPVVAGAGKDSQALGTLTLGLRISDAVAQEIGRLADSDVVLVAGDVILATTLSAESNAELAPILNRGIASEDKKPRQVNIRGRRFEMASIPLHTGSATAVRCYLLVSLESTYAFLNRLNTTILVIALVVASFGAALLRFISSAITLPLSKLISAVRAFARGDSTYTLEAKGNVEVAELSAAFVFMRDQLADSQRKQLEAERLAALGRAAGSISHDLRHHLAALVANAEFLHDPNLSDSDRDELYREIQRASEQMTALIDSLVEISRERRTLMLAEDDLAQIIAHAGDAVRANPEYRNQQIEIHSDVKAWGTFDSQKLQRAFFNLLLNACEAVSPLGEVKVIITERGNTFQCRISDSGVGIPESLREAIFEPFISAGKNNGTGLGLTIASKIIRDHGGDIVVESTSPSGTTFLVSLPKSCAGTIPELARATA
jgi:signal transduction histidine kinase